MRSIRVYRDPGPAEDPTAFYDALEEAFSRVDALFGDRAQAQGHGRQPEAVLASLTAAAVLIIRGKCLHASFTLPHGAAAVLSRDGTGGVRIVRRAGRRAVGA